MESPARRSLGGPAPDLPERVEGDGLVLREWERDEVEAMEALVAANVEHLRPWMPWVALEPLERRARLDLIEGWARGRAAGGDAVYAIEADGEVVGGTGYHRRVGPGGVEVGYWVARNRQGEGIATRSVRLLTATALARPDIDRVEIRHDVANQASRGVCERSGFVLVGEIRRDVEALPPAPAETGRDLLWRATEGTWRP